MPASYWMACPCRRSFRADIPGYRAQFVRRQLILECRRANRRCRRRPATLYRHRVWSFRLLANSKRLAKLRADGALTEDEFQAQKMRLLVRADPARI